MKETVYSVKVGLEGVTSLLMHKINTIQPAGKKKVDYSDGWERTTYLDKDVIVSIPKLNIEAMIVGCKKYYKKNSPEQNLYNGIEIVEFEVPVLFNKKPITLKDIKDNDWIFLAPVVIKGDRVMRARTCIPPGWYLEFTILCQDVTITPKMIKEALGICGNDVGLCDWRPGAKKPGKFGKFEVVKFEVIID